MTSRIHGSRPVDYFGPHGPLCRGFPASIPPQVYVDALARVGQLQRLAEQWVGYFKPLWEKRSSSEQGLAQDEEGCLQRAAQAEQMVKQRQMSFTLNSSNLSSQQMQGYIQELNDLLATVHGWIATAKGLRRVSAPAGIASSFGRVRPHRAAGAGQP